MSFLKDKLKSAEEFGQLKQKVDNLEQQSKLNESRFEKIEEKLDDIKVTLTRIDTSVKNLTKDWLNLVCSFYNLIEHDYKRSNNAKWNFG